VLSVLYVFGTILPAVVQKVDPCTFVPHACDNGVKWSWSNPWEVTQAFAYGLRTFLVNLFTGNWGNASYGHLVLPAAQFLVWWLPDSIQLALFALPIAAVLAYFVGLYSGARRDGGVDVGARLLSIAGLLIPSFIVVLLFLGTFYTQFVGAFGDTPYGLLPTSGWFIIHGGYPTWIGSANNTSPTGLPVIDGAIHGDWAFEQVVIVKTLWQALAIAAVYVAIFLRYARNIVAEAFREPHLNAARARGVDEGTLLWKHTGRRVLPLMLLVFGVTLPIYIGTQALVEAMANDTGVGALLIAEMTKVGSSGFGFSAVSNTHAGNVYQVTIFILVLVVLFGNLCADVLARYMDPRLGRTSR
jgi:peptide/nickel transport system permease protein